MSESESGKIETPRLKDEQPIIDLALMAWSNVLFAIALKKKEEEAYWSFNRLSFKYSASHKRLSVMND